jgi:hypothetical protein
VISLEITMTTSSLSKSERTALWLDRLNRFSQTHQTVASFCALEGISAPSFYQWKRRLGPSVDIAPIVTKRSKPAASVEANSRASFAEVEIMPASGIRVSLPGNVTLELGGRLDAVATVVREVLLTSRQLDSAAPTSEA